MNFIKQYGKYFIIVTSVVAVIEAILFLFIPFWSFSLLLVLGIGFGLTVARYFQDKCKKK